MFVPVTGALRCLDSSYGHVSHILVEQAGMRLTHVAVVEPGVWPVERLIPVVLIGSGAANAIELNCTREALERMIACAEQDARADGADNGVRDSLKDLQRSLVFPEETSLAVPRELVLPGDVSLHRYSAVFASDGPAGHVDGLEIEPRTGVITHVVTRERGRGNRGDIMIPVADIERFEADAVYLSITQEGVANLERLSPR